MSSNRQTAGTTIQVQASAAAWFAFGFGFCDHARSLVRWGHRERIKRIPPGCKNWFACEAAGPWSLGLTDRDEDCHSQDETGSWDSEVSDLERDGFVLGVVYFLYNALSIIIMAQPLNEKTATKNTFSYGWQIVRPELLSRRFGFYETW